MSTQRTAFWFRRDLRLDDNRGLFQALTAGSEVVPVFIFDTRILDALEDRDDRRVSFIHREVGRLKKELRDAGSDLVVRHGDPVELWPGLIEAFGITAIHANHDEEPYGHARDEAVRREMASRGGSFSTHKDAVLYERSEVLKPDGGPYTVFTPYSKRWKKHMADHPIETVDSEGALDALASIDDGDLISLDAMGFTENLTHIPAPTVRDEILDHYGRDRDVPAREGTSRLGVHLRFGTISVRKLALRAIERSADVYLNELIWRDFYHMILHHFPHVVERSFRPKYDAVRWRNDEEEFQAWCEGRTGFPIVDAGMRQLNETGFMHNRLRMITASFLVKDLLVDWRWGEAYFARRLLDYELASNNGGWQWAAGCGTDAAPYFRVFNPESQQKKFDPDGTFIRAWIPEIDTLDYPQPIVDHQAARKRALKTYKEAL